MADPGSAEWRVAVLNRIEPEPVQPLFERVFDDLAVDVIQADVPAGGDAVVLLLRDVEVVASSPLDALLETILLVNAVLYVTSNEKCV